MMLKIETSQGCTLQPFKRSAMGLFSSCGIMEPIPIRGKQMIIAARKPTRIVPKQANFPRMGLSSRLSRLLSSKCFCSEWVTSASMLRIQRYLASLSACTSPPAGISGTDASLWGASNSLASSALSSS